MTKVPGATRSGLNRPAVPAMPTPTGPRLEKAATWSLASVIDSHGWLVVHELVPVTAEHFQTWLVMLRFCSMAPTVMTFLAVPGELIVSALPAPPSEFPPPLLPAEKTSNSGWEPVTVGSASPTAAS